MIALAVICLALLALLAWREREHQRVVSSLLQRIQAPEKAVIEHGDRVVKPSPPPISLLSDEAWEEELERRQLEAR